LEEKVVEKQKICSKVLPIKLFAVILPLVGKIPAWGVPFWGGCSPFTHYYIYINKQKLRIRMIIVPVKEGENIERALKKFKRKAEKTGIIKEVRNRKQFNKPSVVKRKAMQHAIYVNKLHTVEE
jgi:small subunit ribosomal protein S21